VNGRCGFAALAHRGRVSSRVSPAGRLRGASSIALDDPATPIEKRRELLCREAVRCRAWRLACASSALTSVAAAHRDEASRETVKESLRRAMNSHGRALRRRR